MTRAEVPRDATAGLGRAMRDAERMPHCNINLWDRRNGTDRTYRRAKKRLPARNC
ncbi:hypothetical protein [Sphingomonas sp.]|uniref:hypothetical protein n=1 Tax=Sphingomonas sp. TaxID=28214 RepID=UPI002DE2937B|nr:hypothetical protein [Sphingomonas sp.]